jgi:flagellar motor protein MotB
MSIQTRVRFYLFAVMMIGLSLPIQDVRSDAMPATTPYSDSKNIPDNSEYPLPDQAVIVVGRETEVVNQVENQLSKLGVPTSQDIKIQIKSQTISQGASQAISQSTSQFKNDSNSKIVSLGELTCWSESAKKPQPTSTVNPRQETATANAKPEFLKITESPDLKLVIYFKKLDAKMQTEVVDKIAETLNRLAVEKGITRVHITGHTDSDVITGNGLKKFKDNYELSDYRAKTIANILRRNFKSSQMSYEGKGPDQPLASNDDENGKAKNRRTEVWVYYKNVEKIKSTSVTTSGMSGDSRQPESSSTAINELNSNSKQNPFRVTLDGQPFNFPGYQETAPAQHVDFQRCTDVALEKSAVQIKFDPLHADKRLNLTPDRLIGSIHQAIRFRAYSNYLNFIDHAELRVFLKEQSTRLTPYDVMTFTRQGINFEDIYWQPKLKDLEQEYQFVLRVVDAQGFYDETQPLTLKYSLRSDYNTEAGESYLNAGYGENHLAQSKIKVQGGTIRVFGEQIPSTHTLSVMGQSIPRDSEGDFITEQILDSGKNYGIDVAIKNPEGKGLEFRRDLYLPQNNWLLLDLFKYLS